MFHDVNFNGCVLICMLQMHTTSTFFPGDKKAVRNKKVFQNWDVFSNLLHLWAYFMMFIILNKKDELKQ